MDISVVAQDTINLAATNLDSSGLESLVGNFGDLIKTVGAIVIGVVAAGILFLKTGPKMITAFSKDRMSEGAKELGKSAIIVIIAIGGIAGLFAIIDSINPVQEESGVTEYLEN